ncbi:hypothetical protein [Lysobacter capsici]|uniref:hypothetical protein n=1 Tax=Lysobacter capsici TaxID=435897 RepID=UPI00398D5173
MRVADLAFARQEDQHVAARIFAGDFVAGGDDAVVDAARGSRDWGFGIRGPRTTSAADIATRGLADSRFPIPRSRIVQRTIPNVHRIAATLDADHRRAVEMRGETLGVDGRRGDDDLQVAALLQQLLEIAQQEVDVEAAFVRLVDQDRVVGRQPAVGLDFGQQDAVSSDP